MLKHEADALRREINEWRNRAGIPLVEEPARSDGFSMVLSGELEVIAAVSGEDDNEDDNDYIGYEDEFPAVRGHPRIDEIDDPRMASMIKPPHFNPNPNTANGLPLTHVLPRPSAGPSMMASPASYESPNIYEARHGIAASPTTAPGYMHHQSQHSIDADKMVWYSSQPQHYIMQPQQRPLYTPPTSNGHTAASPVSGTGSKPSSPATTHPFNDTSTHAFFNTSLSRHQQGYVSDEGNVGNNGSSAKHISIPNPLPINLARGPPSNTASHGPHSMAMNGTSPDGASPASAGAGSPVYEVDGSFAIRRPPNVPNNGWGDQPSQQQHAQNMMGMGMGGGMLMNGMGMGNGLVGNAMGTMVPVGGGGNGGSFAMMM